MQRQLSTCQQLVTTWELSDADATRESIPPISVTATQPCEPASAESTQVISQSFPDHGPASCSLPAGADLAMRHDGLLEKKSDEEGPLASSTPSVAEDADWNQQQNGHGASKNDERHREMDGTSTTYVENDGSQRHILGKRSRSISEDRDGKSRCSTSPSSPTVHMDGVVAEVNNNTTKSNRRCVWVQSQWEICEHDLMMIFSHFGHVERIDVPRPRAGRRPFAFVHFEEDEAATDTIRRAERGAFGALIVRTYHARRGT